MDGMPHLFVPAGETLSQQTLKSSIGCVGVGLHSGRKVGMTLHPAPAGAGICFRRTDLGVTIPARYDHVVDTRLCTVLGLPDRADARVGTVEHLLAALYASGVHNAVVDIDGPELPILDGSASSFLFLIDCAGLVAQDALVPQIQVQRTVRVTRGDGFAELRPTWDGGGASWTHDPVDEGASLTLAASIEFPAAAIGRQALAIGLTRDTFRYDLARARTFTLASEVEQLRASGLARGGSLANAVVVDGATVLNPGGLHMPDEFVRHKLLDAVGDLCLAGVAIHGRFVSHRGGHTLNNQLLRALFADDSAWRTLAPDAEDAAMAGWPGEPMRVAASL